LCDGASGAMLADVESGGHAREAHGVWAGRLRVVGRTREPDEMFDRPLEFLNWEAQDAIRASPHL
jgi:hypothetical protein